MLKPKNWRPGLLFIFAGSTLFSIGGIWMAFNGEAKGWGVALFFGFGAIFTLAELRLDLWGLGQSDPRTVETILESFPRPAMLRRSRRALLLGSAALIFFVVTGSLMLQSSSIISLDHFIAWFGVVIGGILGISSLVLVLVYRDRLGGLLLDAEGFEMKNLFTSRRTKWVDTSIFELVSKEIPFASIEMITVAYDDTSKEITPFSKINTRYMGRNSGLAENCGFSPENLTRLMNQWRDRALKATSEKAA